MRGQISAFRIHTSPGLAAVLGGARMSSVLFMAKTTSKTTAKTV